MVYLTKEIDILKREQGILQREKEDALLTVTRLKREIYESKNSVKA